MNINKLERLIENLEFYLDKHTVLNTKVSKVNVGWHIDHSLKVINKVVETLKASNPKSYKNNFSFLGRIFFMLGFFPRGKAKVPKHVKPPETILKEDIEAQIKTAKSNIKDIAELDKNAFFKHPIFRNVNKKRVTNFLILHTNHHLKIVRDILKN